MSRFVSTRTLLTETNRPYSSDRATTRSVIEKLKLQLNFNSDKAKNYTIACRMRSFNFELSTRLQRYWGWDNYDSIIRWALKEKTHIKYKETHYKKLLELQESKDVSEEYNDIFLCHLVDNCHAHLRLIHAEEYKDGYGKTCRKIVAHLDGEEDYIRELNHNGFVDKKGMKKIYLNKIRDLQSEIDELKNNLGFLKENYT